MRLSVMVIACSRDGKDFIGIEVLGAEESVDEVAGGAVAGGDGGDEGCEGEDSGVRGGGRGGEAGDAHGGDVIYVVTHVADGRQRQTGGEGELAEGGGLVAAGLEDVDDGHFLGVAVDEGRVFAGDEGKLDAGAAGEGEAHDVHEAEALPFFTVGPPEEAAVGEYAVEIESEGADVL